MLMYTHARIDARTRVINIPRTRKHVRKIGANLHNHNFSKLYST